MAANIPLRNYDYTNDVATANEEPSSDEKSHLMDAAAAASDGQQIDDAAGPASSPLDEQIDYWAEEEPVAAAADESPPDTPEQGEQESPAAAEAAATAAATAAAAAAALEKVEMDNSRRHVNDEEPELVACGGGGGAPTMEQQITEQKETFDHVTNLIRSMREHAIGIIKDMNDLEIDFLGQLGEDDDNRENGNGNNYNAGVAPVLNLCGDQTDSGCPPTTTTTTPAPTTKPASGNCAGCYNDNTDSSSRLAYNSYSPNSNYNNRIQNGASTGGGGGSGDYVVNEWAVPLASDVKPVVTAKEFMQQAHAAIRSWREQIESCKQILDAAISQVPQGNQIGVGPGEGRCGLHATGQMENPGSSQQGEVSTVAGSSGVSSLHSGLFPLGKVRKQAGGGAAVQQENANVRNYDPLLNTLRDQTP